jgi:hypothetical protein
VFSIIMMSNRIGKSIQIPQVSGGIEIPSDSDGIDVEEAGQIPKDFGGTEIPSDSDVIHVGEAVFSIPKDSGGIKIPDGSDGIDVGAAVQIPKDSAGIEIPDDSDGIHVGAAVQIPKDSGGIEVPNDVGEAVHIPNDFNGIHVGEAVQIPNISGGILILNGSDGKQVGEAVQIPKNSDGIETPNDSNGIHVRAQKTERAQYNGSSKCLNFLHIPKTGGTTIEAVLGGLERRPTPGHLVRLRKEEVCHRTRPCPNSFPGLGGRKRARSTCCHMPDGNACSPRHVPPSHEILSTVKFTKCETFCVVRHPMFRFRSEYGWSAAKYGLDACSSESMEIFAERYLPEAMDSPFTHDCHLIPQYEYVGRGGNTHCQHVLKFENLTLEFNALMDKFGVEARLNGIHANGFPCHAEFTDKTKDAIERFYRFDYVAFGYPRY